MRGMWYKMNNVTAITKRYNLKLETSENPIFCFDHGMRVARARGIVWRNSARKAGGSSARSSGKVGQNGYYFCPPGSQLQRSPEGQNTGINSYEDKTIL